MIDLLILLMITCMAWLSFWKMGFFYLRYPSQRKGSLYALLGAFTLLVAIQITSILLLKLIVPGATQAFLGWATFVETIVVSYALWAYSIHWKQYGFDIWGKGSCKALVVGIGTWAAAYPTALTVGKGLGLLVTYFITDTSHIEQSVVTQLKALADNRPLYYAATLITITLIPIIEELLFRGFLQSWTVYCLGRTKGILASSLIFAAFHYSPDQGWANIEMLAALAVLAGFLGYLYEREQSLWAPIALHATFNTISLVQITTPTTQLL